MLILKIVIIISKIINIFHLLKYLPISLKVIIISKIVIIISTRIAPVLSLCGR